MAARDIIVIGGSAGGFEAIRKVAAGFPADLPAAVFVTIHVTGKSDGILPHVISRAGPLLASHPRDGDPIEPGRIYVAPPDYHLLLQQGRIQLSHGPRENLQRPCINVMFRSAAAAYGERVAGVLLTGLLDDGAAGLWEIQQKNGATIVQEPEEATFRSMPDSAIRGLNVQYIVKLAEMGPLLTKLAMTDHNPPPNATPEPVLVETAMQTCPECGGAMTLTRMGPLQEYRCHIGHRFGLRTLIEQKANNIEHILEAALAQSEELSSLLRNALEHPDGEDIEALRRELGHRSEEQRILRGISGNPKVENA
ncbi:MAG TPA: chemotaxis protein CheB [Acidobacteriaceae bacterium]|nr:chemotaxis protein CheB [Acidobacteriaceae bacterium]